MPSVSTGRDAGKWLISICLCTYAETVEVYLRCKSDIDNHGVLVQGRTKKELVRNPALTPLNQARTAIILLAKAVPLANPNADLAGASVDAYIDSMVK